MNDFIKADPGSLWRFNFGSQAAYGYQIYCNNENIELHDFDSFVDSFVAYELWCDCTIIKLGDIRTINIITGVNPLRLHKILVAECAGKIKVGWADESFIKKLEFINNGTN